MIDVQRLESLQVYADRWLSVRRDVVRYPDGSTGSYTVVDCPDVALVIPFDGEGFELVEQYRHAVAGRRWEFPSGSIAPGEAEPATAAARELYDETGLTAETIVQLGSVDTMPSTLNQRCWIHLASDLTSGTPRRDREEQDMRSARFPRAEVEQMIVDGRICDAKSVAAYALLLMRERLPATAR